MSGVEDYTQGDVDKGTLLAKRLIGTAVEWLGQEKELADTTPVVRAAAAHNLAGTAEALRLKKEAGDALTQEERLILAAAILSLNALPDDVRFSRRPGQATPEVTNGD
jgi:hypothetical protein